MISATRPPALHLRAAAAPPLVRSPATRAALRFGCSAAASNLKKSKPSGSAALRRPVLLPPSPLRRKGKGNGNGRGGGAFPGGHGEEDERRMWALCGFGYWLQGFRCFPWLALNFHLTHGLGLGPLALQLVQNTANLPMVAKPLYGMLSDAVYIGGAHRLPYISIGVFLQVLSWGTLGLMPITRDMLPTQMVCILLGNLGASFTEVVSDALVAESSKEKKKSGFLQSCSFMALAAGGIMGNLSGGFALVGTQQPKLMFLSFALLLTAQLGVALTTREEGLLAAPRRHGRVDLVRESVSESLGRQFSVLIRAISNESLLQPLSWIVASIAVVPLLSGTIFCFQTQSLKLDPVVIGLSKVMGQMMVLSASFVYNRHLKEIPFRKLIFWVQIVYAISLLSDLVLVQQVNLKMGISNEAYVLCLSAIAEAVAQFRILPFSVLLAGLCPRGCEGSLFAFFASALCMSSIVSGVFGVGLATLVGVGGAGDSAGLSVGIALQFMAALVPLRWISLLPVGAKLPTRS